MFHYRWVILFFWHTISFTSNTGSTTCTPCQVGTFMNTTGAAICQSCNLGSYQVIPPHLSASTCIFSQTKILLNKIYFSCHSSWDYWLLGSQKKTKKNRSKTKKIKKLYKKNTQRFFQDHEGQSQCKVCTPGTYGPVTKLSACTTCPPNTYSGYAAEDCTVCKKHYHSIAGAKQCSLGTFSSSPSPCSFTVPKVNVYYIVSKYT